MIQFKGKVTYVAYSEIYTDIKKQASNPNIDGKNIVDGIS